MLAYEGRDIEWRWGRDREKEKKRTNSRSTDYKKKQKQKQKMSNTINSTTTAIKGINEIKRDLQLQVRGIRQRQQQKKQQQATEGFILFMDEANRLKEMEATEIEIKSKTKSNFIQVIGKEYERGMKNQNMFSYIKEEKERFTEVKMKANQLESMTEEEEEEDFFVEIPSGIECN